MRKRTKVCWLGSEGTAAHVVGVLCVVATSAVPCAAQGWSVGVVGGTNATRMSFEDPDAQSQVLASPGFHAGGLVELAWEGGLGVRAGALYTQKGFDSDVDEKLELSYIEFPVLFTVRWPVTSSPRVFAGPVVSFEVGCTSTRVLGLGELPCEDKLSSLERSKTDLGLAVGGGVGFHVGTGSVSMELWFNQGLLDMNGEARPPGTVRNQVLLLSLGYRYPLGGET